jgi:hypothetical protein
VCGLADSPGHSYAAYLDLSGYPDVDRLVEHLDDAILDACEQVVAEFRAEDPTLRAMLSPRYALWEHVRVPFDQVRVGMWLAGSVPHPSGHGTARVEGRVLRVTEHWVSLGDGDDGRVTASVGRDDVAHVHAVVPVPLDAATLTEDRPGY